MTKIVPSDVSVRNQRPFNFGQESIGITKGFHYAIPEQEGRMKVYLFAVR